MEVIQSSVKARLAILLFLMSAGTVAHATNQFSLSHAQGQPGDNVAISWSCDPATPANVYSMDMCISWAGDLEITDISQCVANLPPGVGQVVSGCSLTAPACPGGLYLAIVTAL